MEMITSKENEKVKNIKALYKKKHRDDEKKYLIEGVRFVEEALSYIDLIDTVIFAPKLTESSRGQELLDLVIQNNLPQLPVSDQVFKELSDTETPQGIMAVMKMKDNAPEQVTLENNNHLLLVVDGVQDPGNLGTIIRTADATGVTGLILLKGTVDVYNPKTLRSTMGSIFRVNTIQMSEPEQLNNLCREKGIKMIVASANAQETIYEADLTQPIALVVGSEGAGPSEFLTSLADKTIAIPMPGSVESLNVAVATGVILFETLRQRR